MRRAMAWTMSALTMVATVAVAARDTDAARDHRFPRDLYRLDAHALGLSGSALNDRWWACRFSSDRQDLPAGDGCATLWGRPPAFVAVPRATRAASGGTVPVA
ncbi:MAG TPA: hypothetical protein VFY17_11135, partial [Pilimelia sp.]|nr:hypothetical protein [Pilimelia sp.]